MANFGAIYSQSPAVTFREIDLSLSVPQVSGTITAYVGQSRFGVPFEPVLHPTQKDYVNWVGTPDDVNYESWFMPYRQTNYMAGFYHTRVVNTLSTKNAMLGFKSSDSPPHIDLVGDILGDNYTGKWKRGKMPAGKLSRLKVGQRLARVPRVWFKLSDLEELAIGEKLDLQVEKAAENQVASFFEVKLTGAIPVTTGVIFEYLGYKIAGIGLESTVAMSPETINVEKTASLTANVTPDGGVATSVDLNSEIIWVQFNVLPAAYRDDVTPHETSDPYFETKTIQDVNNFIDDYNGGKLPLYGEYSGTGDLAGWHYYKFTQDGDNTVDKTKWVADINFVVDGFKGKVEAIKDSVFEGADILDVSITDPGQTDQTVLDDYSINVSSPLTLIKVTEQYNVNQLKGLDFDGVADTNIYLNKYAGVDLEARLTNLKAEVVAEVDFVASKYPFLSESNWEDAKLENPLNWDDDTQADYPKYLLEILSYNMNETKWLDIDTQSADPDYYMYYDEYMVIQPTIENADLDSFAEFVAWRDTASRPTIDDTKYQWADYYVTATGTYPGEGVMVDSRYSDDTGGATQDGIKSVALVEADAGVTDFATAQAFFATQMAAVAAGTITTGDFYDDYYWLMNTASGYRQLDYINDALAYDGASDVHQAILTSITNNIKDFSEISDEKQTDYIQAYVDDQRADAIQAYNTIIAPGHILYTIDDPNIDAIYKGFINVTTIVEQDTVDAFGKSVINRDFGGTGSDDVILITYENMNGLDELVTFQTGELLRFYALSAGEEGNNISISICRSDDYLDQAIVKDGILFSEGFEFAPDYDDWQVHVAVVYTDPKTNIKTVVEKFDNVSMNPNSKGSGNKSNFIEDRINNSSRWVRIFVNGGVDYYTQHPAWDTTKSDTANLAATGRQYIYNFLSITEAKMMHGAEPDLPSNGDIMNAYDVYKEPEDIEIDLMVGGPYTGVSQYILTLCELRRDCFAILDVDKSDVVNKNRVDATNNVIAHRTSKVKMSSSYGELLSTWLKIYDRYNDKKRWIPAGGDVAGITCLSDFNTAPWWAAAGFNRGKFRDVQAIAFNPVKLQRDQLYVNTINPIIDKKGEGIVLFGQRTLLTKNSYFSRKNVRRLFIVCERAIVKMSQYLLFEFNNPITRTRFINTVRPFLGNIQARQGIIDFLIVCDESNNDITVIENYGFVGDIYIKPQLAFEWLHLNFVNTPIGIDFSEVG